MNPFLVYVWFAEGNQINGAIGRVVGQKVRGEPKLYTLPVVSSCYQRRNFHPNICPWPTQENCHPKVRGSAMEGCRIDLVASLRKWFQSEGRFQGRPPSLPIPPLCSTAATRFISTLAISILLRESASPDFPGYHGTRASWLPHKMCIKTWSARPAGETRAWRKPDLSNQTRQRT